MNRKLLTVVMIVVLMAGLTSVGAASSLTFAEPFEIVFDVDFDTFFSPEYAHHPGNTEEPLFVMLAKWTGTFIEDGKMIMSEGSRWAFGMPFAYQEAKTSMWDFETVGCLDLSKPYVITVEFGEFGPQEGGIFQVFVDNNNTKEIDSPHQMKSNIFTIDAPLSNQIRCWRSGVM